MLFSTVALEALIRSLALPVMMRPSGSCSAAAGLPAAFCFSSAGATTARLSVCTFSCCRMFSILCRAASLALPCFASQAAL